MKLKLPRRTGWVELAWTLGVCTVGLYTFWLVFIFLFSLFSGGPSLFVFILAFQCWAGFGGIGVLIGAVLIVLFDLHSNHGFYLGAGMFYGGLLIWFALDYLFPYGPGGSVWAVTILLTCVATRTAYRHLCRPKVKAMDEEQVIRYAVKHPDKRWLYAQRYDAIYGVGSFQDLMEMCDEEGIV